jgi:hypothetical protein
MIEFTVPNTPEAVADAIRRLPKVFVLLAFRTASEHITRHAGVLGSLIRPREDARRYFDETYWRDPPLFRDWLTSEYVRFLRCGSDPQRWLNEVPPDGEGT